METLDKYEAKFIREYDDLRLFYKDDDSQNEDNTEKTYFVNIAAIEKIAHVKGMSQFDAADYLVHHDLSCRMDTYSEHLLFWSMNEELKNIFSKEEQRQKIQELDAKYRHNCYESIYDYMNELYPDEDQSFIDTINDDQLYRFNYYIQKGYTISKIFEQIEKPD